jgi:hypothetical protein
MLEDENENIALRNKIAGLKERLNQINSQATIDANKSKAFENEFSLYLKACEHANKEGTDGFRLQHEATKFGFAILVVILVFTVDLFNLHIIFGVFVLLGFGFIPCGLMYLILAGEIRITRAGEYCAELETYFKQYRWSSEHNASTSLPGMPLWGEYRKKWENDFFTRGLYEKTAIYAPLRIAMTLTDLVALAYLAYFFVVYRSEIPWKVMIISYLAWVVVVTVQVLLVDAMINKVDMRPEKEKEGLQGYQKKTIGRQPDTWINILKLFLNIDIIFPAGIKKRIH